MQTQNLLLLRTTPPTEIKDFRHLPLHRGGFGAVLICKINTNLHSGGGFQLELQFISDQGNELTVGRLALGVADGIAEKSLQGV